MPLTSIVNSLVIKLTFIDVRNPGFIFIINDLRLLVPRVTSSSERILIIKSVAISSSKSSNCFNSASINSSILIPWSIFSMINAS